MPDIERAMPQDNAGMVKLVYTTDSKSVAFGRGGSSPPTGTIFKQQSLDVSRGFVVSGEQKTLPSRWRQECLSNQSV